MKLRKLSFRNFKSYSNILTEISFNDNSSLNLIIGENGTGKSSIAECATYLLYGKLEDFTASDIPNRINKNFYGKIELDCDGHSVVIERGLNPGLFKVEIDGETVDTAGKANVQGMLEENYFKIPYSVFHNMVAVELGSVKSLLDMNVADKRNIIDKICGFTIYNMCGKIVKEDLKSLTEKINVNDGSLRTMNYTLEQYDRQIEDIKNTSVSQEELDELSRQINEAVAQKTKNDEMLKKLRDAGEQLKGTNIQKVGEYNNLKEKIQVIDKKVKLIDSGRCPTCGSSLETAEFQAEKDELLGTRDEYERQMKMIVDAVNKTKSRVSALGSKEQEIQRNTNGLRIMDLQADLKYKKNMMTKSSESLDALKADLAEKMESINEERTELEEEKKLLDFMVSMYSDGGIKRYISNMYIPIINSLMEDMVQFMGLNYVITFDNNFDASIFENGMKVKYSTLSKGQKARVDFAAIIAFVKFLKLQFGELNLLFLDELFAHVDVNGVNDMIEILRNLSSDMNLNIYLIHHARLENTMFDQVMQTKRVDGFSHIEYL